MDYLIVVNPQANRVRRNPNMLKELLARFHTETTDIIYARTLEIQHERLDLYRRTNDLSKTVVCIVGGDGTFKQMLEWIVSLPEVERPALLPVGGGQFNFMAKHVGFKTGNPIKNLTRLFANQKRFKTRTWKPIRIHDSLSGECRHAAVVANGILCDVVEWYEEIGKGSMLNVSMLIGSAILDHGRSKWSGRPGRLKPTHGSVTVDHKLLSCNVYAGFVLGAVSEFLPSCRPFLKPASDQKFSAIVYSGSLTALAVSVPMVWNGWASPLTDLQMFNDDAKEVVIQTDDPRILIDGDLLTLPTPEGTRPKRTLTATYGPAIRLLYAI